MEQTSYWGKEKVFIKIRENITSMKQDQVLFSVGTENQTYPWI